MTSHPHRRLALRPGQEVECRADADHDRRVDARAVFRHPPLLFRCAQPDPDDVRPRGVDRIDDRAVLRLRHLPERRAERASHLQFRDGPDQDFL